MPAEGQLVTLPFRAWSQALAPSMHAGGCQVFSRTAQGSLQRASPTQQGKGSIPPAPLHGQLCAAGRWGQPVRLPYWRSLSLLPCDFIRDQQLHLSIPSSEGKTDGNMGHLQSPRQEYCQYLTFNSTSLPWDLPLWTEQRREYILVLAHGQYHVFLENLKKAGMFLSLADIDLSVEKGRVKSCPH